LARQSIHYNNFKIPFYILPILGLVGILLFIIFAFFGILIVAVIGVALAALSILRLITTTFHKKRKVEEINGQTIITLDEKDYKITDGNH